MGLRALETTFPGGGSAEQLNHDSACFLLAVGGVPPLIYRCYVGSLGEDDDPA